MDNNNSRYTLLDILRPIPLLILILVYVGPIAVYVVYEFVIERRPIRAFPSVVVIGCSNFIATLAFSLILSNSKFRYMSVKEQIPKHAVTKQIRDAFIVCLATTLFAVAYPFVFGRL